MSKKLLHSFRYDKLWLQHEEPPEMTPEEETQRHAEITEIIRQHNEESEYIPIPERLEKVDEMILLAAVISHEHEIDMDVEQNDGGIDFKLYYSGGLFCDDLKNYVGRMFLLCDDVTVYTPKDKSIMPEGCAGIIHFTYSTHRHIVAGRETCI